MLEGGRKPLSASGCRWFVDQFGQLKEQGAQIGIGHGGGSGAEVFRGARRGVTGRYAVDGGCRDRHHLGGDGSGCKAEAACGVKHLPLFHPDAAGPRGRFDQQQDAVVAQRDVLDVLTERRGQQRQQPLAQGIEFTRPCGQIGERRALGHRRRAVGIAGWQWLGRSQRDWQGVLTWA